MSDQLEEMSDAELNEAFYREILGWYKGRGVKFKEHPESWRTADGGIPMSNPRFSTSADAVLPWLEKCAHAEAIFRHWLKTPDWVVDCTHDKLECAEAREDWSSDNCSTAPTFARAACIALIRAKRAAK